MVSAETPKMTNPFPFKTKTLEGNGSLKINWLVHFKILCPGEHTRKLSQTDLNPGSKINISELLFTMENYYRLILDKTNSHLESS